MQQDDLDAFVDYELNSMRIRPVTVVLENVLLLEYNKKSERYAR
jgi:hypothetical protein